MLVICLPTIREVVHSVWQWYGECVVSLLFHFLLRNLAPCSDGGYRMSCLSIIMFWCSPFCLNSWAIKPAHRLLKADTYTKEEGFSPTFFLSFLIFASSLRISQLRAIGRCQASSLVCSWVILEYHSWSSSSSFSHTLTLYLLDANSDPSILPPLECCSAK